MMFSSVEVIPTCRVFQFAHFSNMDETKTLDSISPPRHLLDIELRCRDGIVQASSQTLGFNSVVFEKMLFALVQMEESRTSVVHLDDIAKFDMELMIQFCKFHAHPDNLIVNLNIDRLLSSLAVAHRFEFTNAVNALSRQLIRIVPVPTSAQIQFVDRLELNTVITAWSAILTCTNEDFNYMFLSGLADFPLSAPTLAIFAEALRESILATRIPQCMPNMY